MNRLQEILIPILSNSTIEEIEWQICDAFDPISYFEDYSQQGRLLRLRKNLINREVLQYQELLMPTIIQFNAALIAALRTTYDETHRMYNLLVEKNYSEDSIGVTGCCYLDEGYPEGHPLQNSQRQDLWEALRDTGWNPLYDSGVSHSLILPDEQNDSFNDFIGLGGSFNWANGLDPELTKDSNLCNAFNKLFCISEYALTDFIFCRKFETKVSVEYCM